MLQWEVAVHPSKKRDDASARRPATRWEISLDDGSLVGVVGPSFAEGLLFYTCSATLSGQIGWLQMDSIGHSHSIKHMQPIDKMDWEAPIWDRC
ncbi:hypothetical protein CONPUDRAFT_81618 [Coniophora puteana RWD-64-598 SS2]|uniref:Uncharacterized protein n=1 Tax=Coniophora puteana (strain RWD-64-598) TaxID=741705 RepID=A0A5M3MSI4_CONPW|nr:uncharacterized protein CONPUDRAFT_81618 [Coniophora puteana RWD-64-598 SS2]EIW82056.1 hypothetical protein CONPUDRAFT_81618 [Coniophora puteana RWD-64-598 SS2]